MTKDELKLALKRAKRDERHLSNAETRYWCNQYKLLATQAIEALAQPEQRNLSEQEHDVLMNAIKASSTVVSKGFLAQPEQEPVGRFAKFTDGIWREVTDGSAGVPLYTTPPQRTWVGLTDDDKVLIKHDANFNQFMTAGEYADRVQQLTEARLKDLNT